VKISDVYYYILILYERVQILLLKYNIYFLFLFFIINIEIFSYVFVIFTS